MFQRSMCLCVWVALLVSVPAWAEEITGTIVRADLAQRTLTIKVGEKENTGTVVKDVKITVDGKPALPTDLKTDQTVKVTGTMAGGSITITEIAAQKAEQPPAAEPPGLIAKAPGRQTVRMPMRDGTKLATDLFLPEGPGPFPVLLTRTPYSKKSNALDAYRTHAQQGYAVVIQDTRGRFDSEGENSPFFGDGWANGKMDGYDTVEWIASQKWCNGKIGTIGGSALGIAQYLMAGTPHPKLMAQWIEVAAPSVYDTAFRGGVPNRTTADDWMKNKAYSLEGKQELLSHATYDDRWKAYDLALRWEKVEVPAVHLGGWYDVFLQGTIDGFVGYQTKAGKGARGRQRMVMGPWAHERFKREVGELVFPENAIKPPGKQSDPLAWFDHWLKGKDTGALQEPAVAYYVMGDPTDPAAPGNQWRTANAWPVPADETPFYLVDSKSLSATKPGGTSRVSYAYDPASPCPTIGGRYLISFMGPRDHRRILSRSDVAVFTGEKLERPLEVTGRVRAKLFVSSDAPDTDFFVALYDVYPDGRSMNVCEGILRTRFRQGLDREVFMKPGETYPIEVDLWSTSIVFNKGHRLQVLVTSSSAQGFDVNPNTGDPLRSSPRTRVANNTLHLGGDQASHVILPIVPSK